MHTRLNSIARLIPVAALLGLMMAVGTASAGQDHHPQIPQPTAGHLLASGLAGTIGGTVGPDGALYVPQGALGKITRIDPFSGKTSTFASGLPPAVAGVGIGGAMDVAFIGTTAYVLVSLVGSDVGGGDIDGIYRLDGTGTFTVVANLGQFALDNPPTAVFDYFLHEGLQFAMQPIDDGFLVSDGHLNRILHVTLHGDTSDISVLKQFDDVVPTGLAATADRVYVARLGPVPHLPANGKVVSFDLMNSNAIRDVAAGVSMIIDVEFGPHGKLYALSQGDFGGGDPGSPALPNTGRLLQVNEDGTFTLLVDKLDRPTSLDFICDTAFIVTLTGQVWKVDSVSSLLSRAHCDDCDHSHHD